MVKEAATWTGASGSKYRYTIYELGTGFTVAGGNYIFCKPAAKARTYMALYIGETGDLSERFDNHHKATCIRTAGATHIAVHETRTATARKAEERDLLAAFSTTCND